MSEQLLTAVCAAGHEWDVWGEVVDDERGFIVDPNRLVCPDCEPFARAVAVRVPESLA